MKFVDEYRDPETANAILRAIADLARDLPHTKFMEVCGGHTHTIYRHGIEQVLPSNIEMVHGPGCPVCVLPMGRMDDAIGIAEQPDVTLATFGDMLRVPGSRGSLFEAKARGADIRMVYSPLDALKLAEKHPDRNVVFLAVGFETTAPSTALTILHAQRMGITNFSVFSNHVTVGPPIRAILDAPDVELSGFVGPGHVSTITGQAPYHFIAEEYRKPIVTAGFEPVDLLQGILMLTQQVVDGRHEVENQYTRVVNDGGNPMALALFDKVFVIRDTFEWRGLGFIEKSALGIHPDFAQWDAEVQFAVPGTRVADPKACQCGQVLRGVLKPWECKVFGTACTPEKPIGTCMVSPEGACAAYYTFGQHSSKRQAVS